MPRKLKNQVKAANAGLAEPVPVRRRPVAASSPKGETTPSFLLVHHPTAWTVEDGMVLPRIVPRWIEPGVGRVDYTGDTALMEAEMGRRGWVILPDEAARPEDTIDGHPGYLRAVDVQGGKRHMTAWEKARVVGDRLVVEQDRRRWTAWRQSLVERGVIAEPDPFFLEGQARMLRDNVLRAIRSRAAGPEDDKEVALVEAQVKALEVAAKHLREGGKLTDLWKRQGEVTDA